MDVAFGVIFVIFFLMLVLGPILRRWLAPMFQKWMLGKMEDNMRRMAGMPTRKEERKRRKREGRKKRSVADAWKETFSSHKRTHARDRHETVVLMQRFAEDVEFTEIKEFGDSDATVSESVKVRYTVEEQIEDAKIIEEIHQTRS